MFDWHVFGVHGVVYLLIASYDTAPAQCRFSLVVEAVIACQSQPTASAPRLLESPDLKAHVHDKPV